MFSLPHTGRFDSTGVLFRQQPSEREVVRGLSEVSRHLSSGPQIRSTSGGKLVSGTHNIIDRRERNLDALDYKRRLKSKRFVQRQQGYLKIFKNSELQRTLHRNSGLGTENKHSQFVSSLGVNPEASKLLGLSK